MYQNIDKAFDRIAGDLVVKKRKSPLGAIVLMAAGLAVALGGKLIPGMGGDDAASAVMIVGWGLVLAGVISFAITRGGKAWNFFYAPTGEPLHRYELSFEAAEKQSVTDCVLRGDFDRLAGIGRSDISSVKVSFYAVGRSDVLWAQVFEFIPHSHEPVTDVIGFAKGQCPLPRELV